MKNYLILLLSLVIISCQVAPKSRAPHWQPIYDRYTQNLNQENIKYNGRIDLILQKAEDEQYATNEYATKSEIEMINVIQNHLGSAIDIAKADLNNYPFIVIMSEQYRRLTLIKERKITYSQAAQLTKEEGGIDILLQW